MAEPSPENWKNYYKILQVRPNAKPKAIRHAYKRLTHLYHQTLSDRTEDSEFFSEIMNDINEAYQILSDPIKRASYDRVFRAKYNSQDAGITKEEIIHLVGLVAQNVLERKRRATQRIPRPSKLVRRAILLALVLLISMLIGGTSFAFAQPQNVLATPFKDAATTLVKTSTGAIGLIEDIREVVASYERNIVYTVLQSMRITEGLRIVPAVTVPTNDMARFPSPEHPLFPDYLDRRFSQFKYTVDSDGIVTVDTSGATTAAFLEKLKQLLDRLAASGT